MSNLKILLHALQDFKSIKKNVPISWIEVFVEIAVKQGQSLKEVAASTGKAEADISRIVESLEVYNLVYKRKDKDEYRVRRLHLTSMGKMLVKNLNMHFIKY